MNICMNYVITVERLSLMTGTVDYTICGDKNLKIEIRRGFDSVISTYHIIL